MYTHKMVDGVRVDLTPEEIAELDVKETEWAAGTNDRKAAKVREERNTKLASTDWTQTADVPQAVKDSYVTYRQALRDISNQSGFPNEITWPVEPQ
jgi:sRNA-binding protein